MAVIEARNITFSVGANVIGCMQSGTFNLNSRTSENPPCRGAASLYVNRSLDALDWSMGVDGGMDPVSTYGYEEIIAAIHAGNAITVTMDIPGAGNNSFQGDAYGSIGLSAGDSGQGGYSVTLEGASDLTILVNP